MEGIPPPTIQVISASVANGRRLHTHIDRDLKDLGLTWGRYHALVVLQRTNGWIHAGAIARKMGVTRQSAHALLHHLDERGLVLWMDDRWVRSARLSADGSRVLAQAHEALGDTFAAIERVEVGQRKALVAAEYAINRELRRPPQRKAWYADYLPEGRQPGL